MTEPNRIQQLDEKTIGHISAGEVVERPAQVVKELLENSLDAGSTSIHVIIERGGFDKIQIEDNGSGIHQDDLALSLDRHATSKMKSPEDLNEIYTLGFRGEALASIGMVSRLTVASRPDGQDGRSIQMEDGNKAELEPFGMAKGTVVTVEHLFENTPVRLGFQRRPATEHARIVEVVVAHAIAHPTVGFRCTIDGRSTLHLPKVESIEDRLYDVLGGQSSSLLPLQQPVDDASVPGEERWSGYISTPDISRGKGDEIHILVNGRPVASTPFHQAIRRGYRTRLMQGRHPVTVLHLEVPATEVDVNVHPTKREVRLRHSWRVLERLERAIAYTLASSPTQPDSSGELQGLEGLSHNSIEKPIQELLTPIKEAVTHQHTSPVSNPPAWVLAAGTQLNLVGDVAEDVIESTEKERPQSMAASAQKILPGMDSFPVAPALSKEERALHRHAGLGGSILPTQESPLKSSENDLPKMEPLSQFADSYILAQAGEELLLIDQHALHERIRYERLRHDKTIWQPQSRLVPTVIEFNLTQQARLEASMDKLNELGFTLEQKSDGEWHVFQAPRLLDGDEIQPFLFDLLQDVSEDGAPLETIERRKDHLAFLNACRGAVKANDELSIAEMRRLLDDMRHVPNPWACVHGRPTALRLSLDSLDKHFGRHG
ncbi:MAG: DNA mismatch repair endonuclease MutL [Candidatus Poseidoniaceae archaeon]